MKKAHKIFIDTQEPDRVTVDKFGGKVWLQIVHKDDNSDLSWVTLYPDEAREMAQNLIKIAEHVESNEKEEESSHTIVLKIAEEETE